MRIDAVAARDFNRIKVEPMTGAIGAEISNVDLRDFDDEVIAEVQQAWQGHTCPHRQARQEHRIQPKIELDLACQFPRPTVLLKRELDQIINIGTFMEKPADNSKPDWRHSAT